MNGKTKILEKTSPLGRTYCIFEGSISKNSTFAPYSVGEVLDKDRDVQSVTPTMLKDRLQYTWFSKLENVNKELIFIGEMFDEFIETIDDYFPKGKYQRLLLWRDGIVKLVTPDESFEIEFTIAGRKNQDDDVICWPRIVVKYGKGEYVLPHCETLDDVILQLKMYYPCNILKVIKFFESWIDGNRKAHKYLEESKEELDDVDQEIIRVEKEWHKMIWERFPELKPLVI